MSYRSVYCVASSHAQTGRILRGLGDVDFPVADISALFLDLKPESAVRPKTGAKSPEKDKPATPSYAKLGQLSAMQVLAVAAIGNLNAAGPVTMILKDVEAYGISGGLLEFGVPASEAQRYEARIRAGHVFLSIRTENPDKSDRARDLFATEGAEEIRTLMDVLTPKLLRRASYGERTQPLLSSR